jgi:hypothetical protein
MKRLPIYFFLIGAGLKTLLIAFFKLTLNTNILRIIDQYDPLGSWIGGTFLEYMDDASWWYALSDLLREMIFIFVIVIAFAFECLILGIIVRMVARRIIGNRLTELDSSV